MMITQSKARQGKAAKRLQPVMDEEEARRREARRRAKTMRMGNQNE